MAPMRGVRRLGLLLLAVVFLAMVPTVATAEDTIAFTLDDARITESSGLAVDSAGNLYWTVNDSGDRGVAYGIGLDGTVQGTLNFRAQPEDVEAVAVHEDRLYIADIGDNSGQRDFIRVYRFTNPRANGLTVTYQACDEGPECSHLRGAGKTETGGRQRARGGRPSAIQCHRRDLSARWRQNRAADLHLGGGHRRDQLRSRGERAHSRSAPGGVADHQPGPEVAARRQRGQEVEGVRHTGTQRCHPDAHAWGQHRSRR
jgi:hypothetical protein